MAERKTRDIPAIKTDITTYLGEGCVLSKRDLREIITRHGHFTSYLLDLGIHKILEPLSSFLDYPSLDERLYQLGTMRVFRTKYKGVFLYRNADLPLEETEWAEVTRDIDNMPYRGRPAKRIKN